jgi:hypothetical protein
MVLIGEEGGLGQKSCRVGALEAQERIESLAENYPNRRGRKLGKEKGCWLCRKRSRLIVGANRLAVARLREDGVPLTRWK